MRLRPDLIACAALAAATPARAQLSSLLQPGPTQSVQSTPTPTQPLVAPGLPSRPDLAPGTQWPVTPAVPAPAVPTAPDTGRTVRLEQHQMHPSGVIMSLDSITFRADSIVVSATILNPSDRPAWLNQGGGLTLADDRGRSYPFVPPADNPNVQIAAQSRVTASLVFAGPLAGDTRTVQLSINGPSGDRSSRLTSAPAFLFRVPVS